MNALADFSAFKDNRAAQVIFKTLLDENVFSAFENTEAIGNLNNEVFKYSSIISDRYGYRESIVVNIVWDILLGTGKCNIEDVTDYIPTEAENLYNFDEKEAVSENVDVVLTSTGYVLPPIDIFQETNISIPNIEDLASIKSRLEWVLSSYGIQDYVVTPVPGYRVSMYEIEMPPKYVGKIVRNEKDILMALGTTGCRLVNPLPDKLAVGIEIPNSYFESAEGLRLLMSSLEASAGDVDLCIPIGLDSTNNIITFDLKDEPFLLICGGSQQGKTDMLRQIVIELLSRNTPNDVRFIFAASNPLELSEFDKINPMFLAQYDSINEVIVSERPSIHKILRGLSKEKETRLGLLQKAGASSIQDYNSKFMEGKLNPTDGHHYLPHIVMCIDEYAPIFDGKSWDDQLSPLFERIKGTGIHFIVTTKLTSASNLTPLIRTYFENRICFRIQMQNESRLAVNSTLATTLLPCGDVILCSNGSVQRCLTVKCDADSIKELIRYTNKFPMQPPYMLPENPDWWEVPITSPTLQYDPMLEEVARYVVLSSTASTSAIQRRYSIGYNRAGKIMDQLETIGVVEPSSGGMPRNVLVDVIKLESILSSL